MEITYVGHACYLVRLGKFNVLVDPLLTSDCQAGTAIVRPKREVDLAGIPPLHAVVLTHSHPGHLEIPSLSMLHRGIPIIHPEDPFISKALCHMGFKDRTVVKAGQQLGLSSHATIQFTSSESNVNEIGIVFDNDGKRAWYLADSMPALTEAWELGNNAQRLGLLIGNYPAYNHDFFSYGEWGFPEEGLRRAMEIALAVHPRLFSPSFSNLQYTEPSAWLNNLMFPITEAQVCASLERCRPSLRTAQLRPGDVIHLNSTSTDVRASAAEWIRVPQDSAQQTMCLFDPWRHVPELRDPDPERLGAVELSRRARSVLEGSFESWLQDEVKRIGTSAWRYCIAGTRQRFHIVLPGGTEDVYDVHFDEPPFLRVGACDAAADIALRIAASALDRWHRAEIPYFAVYPLARPSGAAWTLATAVDGTVNVRRLPSRNLLSAWLSGDSRRVYEPWICREVERHLRTPASVRNASA